MATPPRPGPRDPDDRSDDRRDRGRRDQPPRDKSQLSFFSHKLDPSAGTLKVVVFCRKGEDVLTGGVHFFLNGEEEPGIETINPRGFAEHTFRNLPKTDTVRIRVQLEGKAIFDEREFDITALKGAGKKTSKEPTRLDVTRIPINTTGDWDIEGELHAGNDPVAGQEVKMLIGGTKQTATTNAAGRFSFDDVKTASDIVVPVSVTARLVVKVPLLGPDHQDVPSATKKDKDSKSLWSKVNNKVFLVATVLLVFLLFRTITDFVGAAFTPTKYEYRPAETQNPTVAEEQTRITKEKEADPYSFESWQKRMQELQGQSKKPEQKKASALPQPQAPPAPLKKSNKLGLIVVGIVIVVTSIVGYIIYSYFKRDKPAATSLTISTPNPSSPPSLEPEKKWVFTKWAVIITLIGLVVSVIAHFIFWTGNATTTFWSELVNMLFIFIGKHDPHSWTRLWILLFWIVFWFVLIPLCFYDELVRGSKAVKTQIEREVRGFRHRRDTRTYSAEIKVEEGKAPVTVFYVNGEQQDDTTHAISSDRPLSTLSSKDLFKRLLKFELLAEIITEIGPKLLMRALKR